MNVKFVNSFGMLMPYVDPKKIIITEVGIYTTASGHVAFIQTLSHLPDGEPAFCGYVMTHKSGKQLRRDLVWLKTGVCVSSEDEQDSIVWKA